jgi:hypothetical protein
VQFIESSTFGVRSARLSFASRTNPVRITLFPMVHVGEPEFYEATYKDVLTHDVVLVEGIGSPITTRITRSYRWLVGSRAMAGLVVQPRLPGEGFSARVVHADLSAKEFEREWRAAPLWIRAATYVIAPVVGLLRRYSNKTSLAKTMACEDQPSMSELLAMSPETGALTQAILHSRDQRLVECLRAELDGGHDRARTLAIVYGAAHMRAVVREITSDRHYYVEASEWRPVLTFD